MYFTIMPLSQLWKRRGPPFINKFDYHWRNDALSLCQVWQILAYCFWRKINVVKFNGFWYYLSLMKDVVLRLNKLEPTHTIMRSTGVSFFKSRQIFFYYSLLSPSLVKARGHSSSLKKNRVPSTVRMTLH